MSTQFEKVCELCKEKYFSSVFHYKTSRFCSRKCSTKHRLSIQDFKQTGKNISDSIKEKQNNGTYIHPLQGKHHTEETKQKISKTRTENGCSIGENNPNWKGGTSFLGIAIRDSKEYHIWRNRVFDRDNRICVNCGKQDLEINADHIIPFSYIIKKFNIKTIIDARNCSMLWDITNGRTLCIDCHRQTDTFAGKANKFKELDF